MTKHGLSLEERFWPKVDKSKSCWEWIGHVRPTGYGTFCTRVGAKVTTLIAHRIAYELSKGPIQPGMVIDHICRNRRCVNPDHLRQVTLEQNNEHQDGHRDSRSSRRGVAWHSHSRRWRVTATKNGKTYWGGYFQDVDEAAEAARQLRLKIFTHNDLDRMAS